MKLPAWLTRWLRPRPAEALALWGKSPTHPDFLSCRASPEVARQWQHWLHRHWPAAPQRVPASPWMQLSPAPSDRSGVPVGFVLPPGALPFSGPLHVAGVLVDSRDAQGRRHPLLVWRCMPLEAVLGHARTRGWPWWHAQAQLLERWAVWFEGAAADGAATPAQAWQRLCDAAVQLDAQCPATAPALQASLARLLPDPSDASGVSFTASGALRGVVHMPWPDWPGGASGVARCAAFWQQDAEGGIVSAASTLAAVMRPVRGGA